MREQEQGATSCNVMAETTRDLETASTVGQSMASSPTSLGTCKD